MRIRQSEITAFNDCRRKHHFGYTRNLEPDVDGSGRMPPKEKADAGSAFHAGAEVFHQDGSAEEAEAAVKAWVVTRSELDEEAILADKEWNKVLRLGVAMLEGYIEWCEVEGIDVGWRVVAVEYQWEVELFEGVWIYGQIDLVLEHISTGLLRVVDLKSKDSAKEAPQPVDFQLRTYSWAVDKLFDGEVDDASWRVAKRVLRTGRANPPFYMEHPIPITRGVLERHEEHLKMRVLAIMEAREYHPDPDDAYLFPNPGPDCSWKCDFTNLCPMVDLGDDWETVVEFSYRQKAGSTTKGGSTS